MRLNNSSTHLPARYGIPFREFSTKETKRMIQSSIDPSKSPGFDLITGKVVHEFSEKKVLNC